MDKSPTQSRSRFTWIRLRSLLSHLLPLVQASANEERRLKWLFPDFFPLLHLGRFIYLLIFSLGRRIKLSG